MRGFGKIGFLLAVLLCSLAVPLSAQQAKTVTLRGTVTEAMGGEPVSGAIIRLDENYLWAVTDADGRYLLENVQPGTYLLEIDCLGYVTRKEKITVTVSRDKVDYTLQVNSLALDEVRVTASKSDDAAGTTRVLGRNALDHLQMTGVSDIAALLPGGKTLNPDLTADNQLVLRNGGTLAGNAAFGTAVEVDGVRLGGNASTGEMAGVGTRSLGVENIEAVEVVTGVPSAEYGDLNSGLIRIITQKGRTPVKATFSVNPRTYEVSVSKGFDLGDKGGILNVSGEWARATSKLSSPYKAYTRRSFTFDYSKTFHKKLRLEAGLTGNIGGMNSESDPDLFKDEFEKVRDNVLTPHFKLVWLLNKSWVTNVSLDGNIYYHDERTHIHAYNSNSSSLPAVHNEQLGYFLADALPPTYYSDEIIDSKELDYSASLKYNWLRHFGRFKSVLKAGVQWKATGNIGEGEYYEDPLLAASGYRPRPYTDFPYMHNLSVYAEERFTIPLAGTELDLTAGLRLEKVMISGAAYDRMTTLSPRLNAKWKISKNFSLHGGWGVTEKLPSFYILYPEEEYRDILTFGVSYPNGHSGYVYYTQPYYPPTNPDLRWQRNNNTEIGLDASFLGTDITLSLWRNVTHDPYKFGKAYRPISYVTMAVPAGFTPADDPAPLVDHQTGQVWMRDADGYRVPMDVLHASRSFAGADMQMNGSDVERYGVELTADFPEIRAIRTRLRLDGSYTHTYTVDETLYSYYNRTMIGGEPYHYVGIYPGGNTGNTVSNGLRFDNLDVNLTAITHIPSARLVITCRLEAALLRHSQRLSEYQGKQLAFRLDNGYSALWPVAWMDLDGKTHPFTEQEKADDAFSLLLLKSGNIYTFDADGYDPYFSANLSITKEIGDHVSFSFFANNFTNARPYVKSYATGVAAIFTPAFYYGLTCRIKL